MRWQIVTLTQTTNLQIEGLLDSAIQQAASSVECLHSCIFITCSFYNDINYIRYPENANVTLEFLLKKPLQWRGGQGGPGGGWGGGGGKLPPPPLRGLKIGGAIEHKGRQQLKVCNNLFSFRYVNHTMAIESAITRWNKGCETLPAPPPPPPPPFHPSTLHAIVLCVITI